jgi:hypothetical protein
MQSDGMPLKYAQGPISEWLEIFHGTLGNCPFIQYCEEWLGISELGIVEPLPGEFSSSVGTRKQH